VVGDGTGGGPDIGRLLARRLTEYVDLWESVAAKLTTATYRSENLVDDWFRFWGKAARDVTAGTALMWGAAATAAQRDRSNQ
jgi:uncharacterized heparinase superfamily protein